MGKEQAIKMANYILLQNNILWVWLKYKWAAAHGTRGRGALWSQGVTWGGGVGGRLACAGTAWCMMTEAEVFIPLLSRGLCRALDLKYVNHTKLQANSTFNFQFKLTALQCVTWGTFIQLCPVQTSFATGSESSLRAQSRLWSVNISLTIPNTRHS